MVRRSSETDIDPKRLDVATSPRRRRKRAQPEPSASLKGEKGKALARALKRPVPPAVMLEPRRGGGYEAVAPHSDEDLHELMIADAFGTRSHSVMMTFLRQLSYLVGESVDDITQDWKIDEQAFSAALAIVKAAAPKNEVEACLAAQMVAVHFMQMRLSKRALKWGAINLQDAAVAAKLARTFVMQTEALQGLKGKRRSSRQTITVRKELHQSIHYHDHRASDENGRQPHETTAAAIGECAKMPGDESRGKVLRLPSRKGKGGV